jgi:hypothetical protein
MSALKVISTASTPLLKFLWTLKETVLIKFTLCQQPHELELLHVNYSKEVFVLLDQTLVAKLDRREIAKQPARVDVGGTTVFLSYREGSFKLERSSSLLTATTQASGVETGFDSKKVQEQENETENVEENEKAFFARLQYAKARLYRLPIRF